MGALLQRSRTGDGKKNKACLMSAVVEGNKSKPGAPSLRPEFATNYGRNDVLCLYF